ncbi:MAG: hypothetical protein AAGJ53_05270 [Pseudomonadota bacterium]
MPEPTSNDWAALRVAFENGTSVTVLARRFGVSRSRIYHRSRAEDWAWMPPSAVTKTRAKPARSKPIAKKKTPAKRKAPRPARKQPTPKPPAKPTPTRTTAPTKPTRPATTIPTVKPADAPLAKRLLAAIDLQLKELESRMAMSEDLTSADYERETRALGGLIRNYEKIIGLDAANDNRARKAGDHDARPTDASGADADSVRRDVAARLVRLRARLDDGTGSADHGAE